MSDYPEPDRGDWVSFHRRPVYTDHCHRKCRSAGGHQGYAEIGQVTGDGGELFWGRPTYRVAYWHETTKGDHEQLSAVVSADRLIAIHTPPPEAKPHL